MSKNEPMKQDPKHLAISFETYLHICLHLTPLSHLNYSQASIV